MIGGKVIAMLMVKQIMLDAARDKTEETIKLTKKPGKKGSNKLEINVIFNCVQDRIPIYCEKIIKTAANATNVSFEEMIKHLTTCHQLMDEVASEETKDNKKEATDED